MKKEHIIHFLLFGFCAPYVGATLFCLFSCLNAVDAETGASFYCLTLSLFESPIGMLMCWKVIVATTGISFIFYLVVRKIRRKVTRILSICMALALGLPYIVVLRRAGMLVSYQYAMVLVPIAVLTGYLSYFNWRERDIQQIHAANRP